MQHARIRRAESKGHTTAQTDGVMAVSALGRVQYFDDVRTAAWHLTFKGRRHPILLY